MRAPPQRGRQVAACACGHGGGDEQQRGHGAEAGPDRLVVRGEGQQRTGQRDVDEAVEHRHGDVRDEQADAEQREVDVQRRGRETRPPRRRAAGGGQHPDGEGDGQQDEEHQPGGATQ